ncbi:DddA-like double-stranded DNA deaminase toxin [Longispora sp. K20-0274]|uniref:DddA-like double-stranded DNA deaminase toxin n=1 Tax=Longispora sp. K20-0274 TaxID=3088255 RepID=UPI00399BBDAB
MTSLAERLTLGPGVKVAGVIGLRDGKTLHDGVITNGAGYQVVDNAATLKPDVEPFNRIGNIGLTHVEGHMAALIRERALATGEQVHATAVLTKRPCPGPMGCHENLHLMLPFGSTLTVYVREPNGALRQVKTYVGTGLGVKP